jgi:hypothetical protein
VDFTLSVLRGLGMNFVLRVNMVTNLSLGGHVLEVVAEGKTIKNTLQRGQFAYNQISSSFLSLQLLERSRDI